MLLFFNWYGYQIAVTYLQKDVDQKLESLIDNNDYDESELMEIRVALNMPYQERYTDFERHYGEITVDGKLYTYVKRKIEGDVLVLKCISNYSKQQLKSSADNVAKANSDQNNQTQGKKQSNTQLKIFGCDLENQNQFGHLNNIDQTSSISVIEKSASLNDVLILTPHQPPRC